MMRQINGVLPYQNYGVQKNDTGLKVQNPQNKAPFSQPVRDVFTRRTAKSPSSSLNFKAFSFSIPPKLVQVVEQSVNALKKPTPARVVDSKLVVDSGKSGKEFEIKAIRALLLALPHGPNIKDFRQQLQGVVTHAESPTKRVRRRPLTLNSTPPLHSRASSLTSTEMKRRLLADLHMTGNRVDVKRLSERQRTFLEQQAESYCTAVTNEERAAIRAATVKGLQKR